MAIENQELTHTLHCTIDRTTYTELLQDVVDRGTLKGLLLHGPFAVDSLAFVSPLGLHNSSWNSEEQRWAEVVGPANNPLKEEFVESIRLDDSRTRFAHQSLMPDHHAIAGTETGSVVNLMTQQGVNAYRMNIDEQVPFSMSQTTHLFQMDTARLATVIRAVNNPDSMLTLVPFDDEGRPTGWLLSPAERPERIAAFARSGKLR